MYDSGSFNETVKRPVKPAKVVRTRILHKLKRNARPFACVSRGTQLAITCSCFIDDAISHMSTEVLARYMVLHICMSNVKLKEQKHNYYETTISKPGMRGCNKITSHMAD